MIRHSILAMLILVVACPARASQIQLDPQYRLAKLNQMPRPLGPAGLETTQQTYDAHDAVQWRATLTGSPSQDAPLIENLWSADFSVTLPSPSQVSLLWSKGSHAQESDFQPRTERIDQEEVKLESFGGRSSDGAMPFFNLVATDADGQQGGLIMAIGWSGDWRASFQKASSTQIQVRAGLKRTRFRLAANETVQLPSILVMSYRGSAIDGQNKFRRLLLAHFTPKNHPAMKLMPVAASVHGMLAFNDTNEENLKSLASHLPSTRLPLDTYWLDAGWNEAGFPGGQGNPLPDASRFPNGLAPIGSAAQEAGLRFLMWFEPERAMRGTWLDQQHPQWLLKPSGTPPELRYMENDGFRLLDLGNPHARQWALESVSQEIQLSHVDIYRQDFNEYPAYFWHTDQADDSVGLREIRYINGLYDFLDQLQQRHPNLIIDNCASGGRRLDIELLKRSVCLWRSDSCWDASTYPRNVQAMTHGLSHWLPLHGLGSVATDPVSLRSGMGACASFAINYRDAEAVERLNQHLQHYLPIRELFTRNYYPLTAWSTAPGDWLGIQFHDPSSASGLVQAFHGATDTVAEIQLKLHGLADESTYLLSEWDHPETRFKRTGRELATTGIQVSSTANVNEARVWQYYRVP